MNFLITRLLPSILKETYKKNKQLKIKIKEIIMKNPIIEKAIEEFDKVFNKIFLVNVKHQAFTEEQWNNELAPLFREMRELITTSYD